MNLPLEENLHKKGGNRGLLKRLLLVANPEPVTRPSCQEAHHDSLSMWASFFVLLNAVFISFFSITYFRFYWIAVGYFFFVLIAHTIILRYFYCTRCDHYDNECASVLYAPQLTRRLFSRRKGTWTRIDTLVGTFTWLVISQTGTAVVAFQHSIFFVLLNALAWFAWRVAHSALACQRCLNNHVCPKGKAAVAGENYFAVMLFTLFPLPVIAWVIRYLL